MKRIQKGLIAGFISVVVCTAVFATVPWQKAFNDLYRPKSDSAIKKAKCAVCHVDVKGKGALNSYGKPLKGKKVEAASLRAIESKDADRDRVSNIAEIKAGTLPGDPKSKPNCK